MAKIFLSYAAEDRDLAEPIAHSLRGRGHTVFFDRSDLPPGDNFEIQIEKAIGKSSFMIFLISPNSVADGRFTLTELKFAGQKWKSAKDRILPVMLKDTPKDAIPSYLRAVTILEPQGNAPAEIAQEVDKFVKNSSRPIQLAVTAVMLLGFALSIWWYIFSPPTELNLMTDGPKAYKRGFFGDTDLYRIDVTAKNSGADVVHVSHWSLDVEPEGALILHEEEVDLDRGRSATIAPGSSVDSHFLVNAADENRLIHWRVCAYTESKQAICTQFVKYDPKGEFIYKDKFVLDEHLTRHAVDVAWDGEAFLVAAETPDRIIRLGEDGAMSAESMLEGIPTSIGTGKLGIYVGMTEPDKIVHLDSQTLHVKRELSIELPNNLYDEPVSTRPASLAQDGENIWIITRGSASANGLAVLDSELTTLQTPPYYDDVSFYLPGMILKNGNGNVWSGDNATSPSSIRHLTITDLTEFGGHDYEISECAGDVLPIGLHLFVPNCDGQIYMAAVDRGKIRQGRKLGNIIGYRYNIHETSMVLMDKTTDDKYLAAVTIFSDPLHERSKAILSVLNWREESRKIFEIDNAEILDMAVGRKTVLLILQNNDKETQLVSINLN